MHRLFVRPEVLPRDERVRLQNDNHAKRRQGRGTFEFCEAFDSHVFTKILRQFSFEGRLQFRLVLPTADKDELERVGAAVCSSGAVAFLHFGKAAYRPQDNSADCSCHSFFAALLADVDDARTAALEVEQVARVDCLQKFGEAAAIGRFRSEVALEGCRAKWQVFSASEVQASFEGERIAAENDGRMVNLTEHYGGVACIQTRCRLLNFVVRVVFALNDNQTQIAERQPYTRAGADYHAALPASCSGDNLSPRGNARLRIVAGEYRRTRQLAPQQFAFGDARCQNQNLPACRSEFFLNQFSVSSCPARTFNHLNCPGSPRGTLSPGESRLSPGDSRPGPYTASHRRPGISLFHSPGKLRKLLQHCLDLVFKLLIISSFLLPPKQALKLPVQLLPQLLICNSLTLSESCSTPTKRFLILHPLLRIRRPIDLTDAAHIVF